MNISPILAPILAVLAGMGGSAMAAPPSTYLLQNPHPLPGNEGWDYLSVDSALRRIYVSRADHVLVLDADTQQKISEIPGTLGVHGIAFSSELNRGFTSNGKSSTITFFDLKTFKKTAEVHTGENPDAIVYEPSTQRVFSFNGGSHTATVVDAKGGQALGEIPLSGKPEFAVSDHQGKLYVNIEDKNAISEIDAHSMKVLRSFPLGAACESPTGLAIDVVGHRLFSACEAALAVVDYVSGKVVATVPIGPGADAVSFDSELKVVLVPTGGDGQLTFIRQETPDHYAVQQKVATQKSARTAALDTRTHRVFLVAAQLGPKPAPTADNPHGRPQIVPGSVTLLIVSPRAAP